MPKDMYGLLWIFITYSFFGWCMEVAFAAFKTKKFTNRGFLNGPVCPIYGFGMVAIILTLTPLQNNILLLFVGAVFVTSLLEYVAGLIMEKFFGTRWWDYSELPFNISGYICLQFSLVWGIGCIVVIKVIHPVILKIIEYIPVRVSQVVLTVFFIYFIVDLVITVTTLLRFNKKLKILDETSKKMRVLSDEIGEDIYDNVMRVLEKTESFQREHEEMLKKITDITDEFKEDIQGQIDDIKEDIEYKRKEFDRLKVQFIFDMHKRERGFNRIVKAFPSMKNKQSNDVLQMYKKHIDYKRKK